MLEILPTERWVCQEAKEEGEPADADCSLCCKVVMQGHYRTSDTDSLNAISIMPTWGFTERGEVVTSVGTGKPHLVITSGPDHTLRMWNADDKVQSRIAILEGAKSGGCPGPPLHDRSEVGG